MNIRDIQIMVITVFTVFMIAIFLLISTNINTPNTVRSKEIKYHGHDMIEYYNDRTNNIISIIHSPECKKCQLIYD